MPFCSHYTADSDKRLSRDYCNPCFGNLPFESNEIVYYPTGQPRDSLEFLDFYAKNFVMEILPDFYAKRITFDKTMVKVRPHSHNMYCYPGIHLVSTGLRRLEVTAILQMFRYPFEWLSFERDFVSHMERGLIPTDAWIYAHTMDNPDHGLLNYNSLMSRNDYIPGTYNLTERFLNLSENSSIFRTFSLI